MRPRRRLDRASRFFRVDPEEFVRNAGEAVRVRVPGKINLHLGVGPIGADGYHPVVTVLQAVSICDEIVAEPDDGISVSVAGEGAAGGGGAGERAREGAARERADPATGEAVPIGPENLAHRAAVLLARRAGVSRG